MSPIKQDIENIKEIISSMSWQIKILEKTVGTLQEHKQELETIPDLSDAFDKIVYEEISKQYKN